VDLAGNKLVLVGHGSEAFGRRAAMLNEGYRGEPPAKLSVIACGAASGGESANAVRQMFTSLGGQTEVSGYNGPVRLDEFGRRWVDDAATRKMTMTADGQEVWGNARRVDLTGQDGWLMIPQGPQTSGNATSSGARLEEEEESKSGEIPEAILEEQLSPAQGFINVYRSRSGSLRVSGPAGAVAHFWERERQGQLMAAIATALPTVATAGFILSAVVSMGYVARQIESSGNGPIPFYSLNGTDASQVALKQGLNTIGMMVAPYAAFAMGHNRASVPGLTMQSAVRVLTLGLGAYGALKLNMAANQAEAANFYQALGGIGISPAMFDFAYLSVHGVAQAAYPIVGALRDGMGTWMKTGSKDGSIWKLLESFSAADQRAFVTGKVTIKNAAGQYESVSVSSLSTLLNKGMPHAVFAAHAYGAAFVAQAFLRNPMLDALKISGQHSFPDVTPGVAYAVGFQIEMTKFLIGHAMNKLAYASGMLTESETVTMTEAGTETKIVTVSEIVSPSAFRTGFGTLWANKRVTAYHVGGDIASTLMAVAATAAMTTYLNPRSTQQFGLEYLTHVLNEVGPYGAMKILATRGGKDNVENGGFVVADPGASFQYAGALVLGLSLMAAGPGALASVGLVFLAMMLSRAGGHAAGAAPTPSPNPLPNPSPNPPLDPENPGVVTNT
jgi:hypothetical protein